jgi:hypothetical protein
MRFDTWNLKSLNRAGAPMIFAKRKLLNISSIKWEYRRSDGADVTPDKQTNAHCPTKSGTRTMD